MNKQSDRRVIGARTGLEPHRPYRAGTRDVLFTFHADSLADSCRREFCFTTDQTLLALARAEDRIGRLIVADSWRWAPGVALRSLRARGSGNVAGERVTLVKPWRLRRYDPTTVPALRRSYRRYDSVLERQVRRNALDCPAVITFNPFVAAFCPLRWASSVTYYAMDDCAASAAPLWPAFRQAWTVIRQRGTRVVCVSDELAERVAGDGPAVVIPNGVSVEEWREPPPAPAAFCRLLRPVVTYAGTIDDRLDTGLVDRMADDPAIGSIAMIGPCVDRVLERKLKSIPKVTLCGWMGRTDYAGALVASDVCIIPHVANPVSGRGQQKLYEYLAAGKPVVTTELRSPVNGVSERVITTHPEAFVSAVRTALDQPRQDEKDRQEFLHSNSWDARHDRTLRVLLSDDKNWWTV